MGKDNYSLGAKLPPSAAVTVTAKRATEAWNARNGLMRGPESVLTPEECRYIHNVWSTMPGYTCWMDAFFKIMREEVTE